MVTRDRARGTQARRLCILSLLFFLLSSFLLLTFIVSFSVYILLKQAGRDGAGQDRMIQAATALRDGMGDRRAGGGGRRRQEGGLARNRGTAEAEGRGTKGCEQELRGADGTEDEGGASGHVRVEARQHCCCRASVLAICLRHGQFPSLCTVHYKCFKYPCNKITSYQLLNEYAV